MHLVFLLHEVAPLPPFSFDPDTCAVVGTSRAVLQPVVTRTTAECPELVAVMHPALQRMWQDFD